MPSLMLLKVLIKPAHFPPIWSGDRPNALVLVSPRQISSKDPPAQHSDSAASNTRTPRSAQEHKRVLWSPRGHAGLLVFAVAYEAAKKTYQQFAISGV
jgi:hypothetical protein